MISRNGAKIAPVVPPHLNTRCLSFHTHQEMVQLMVQDPLSRGIQHHTAEPGYHSLVLGMVMVQVLMRCGLSCHEEEDGYDGCHVCRYMCTYDGSHVCRCMCTSLQSHVCVLYTNKRASTSTHADTYIHSTQLCLFKIA